MKKQLIDTYFKAWEKRDIKQLKEVLTPNNFGIRTFIKKVCYSLDSLQQLFDDSPVSSYKATKIVVNIDTAIVTAEVQTDIVEEVLIKFTFNNNTIRKVYEVRNDPKIRRLQCRVTYDGSRFSGFQKQPNLTTIQGTIERALKALTKTEVTIHASGRTDKGVHAIDQVFHFDTKSTMETHGFYQLLNKYLPDEIYIKSCDEVDITTHSRYDVKAKEYMYMLNLEKKDIFQQNYEWHPRTFDLELFTSELQVLIGTHNFASFTKTNNSISYERTIYKASITFENGKMKVYIKGNGFLRYMMRNIIAALVLIASGETTFSIESLIKAEDNSILQELAPSGGLYLSEVTYYE